MDFHDVDQLLTLVLVPVESAVCALAFWRRLWRTLPFFTAYLLLVVIIDGVRWSVILVYGAGSLAHSWTYWMTQPLLMLARGAALADICRAALGLYTGVWQLARYLLGVAVAAMLTLAAVHTGGSSRITSYLVFVERELEFAVVVTLLMLLVLSRYYGVALDRPLGGMAMGFALYSSVVIIDSSILIGPLRLPWIVFSAARSLGYSVALGCWAYALRAPLPAPVRPELSTVESYERNSRVVSGRMRELTARLMDLMKR
jgi:hypothetical protein